MDAASELRLSTDHPVTLELKSLRSAVATFQHEAHEASVKLQNYSLDSSRSHERSRELESENTRLKEEIAVLRENPDISPHPDSLRLQELDLTRRRLLDQLGITEATLELRTNELTNAQSELLKAKQDAEGAFELASRIRAREEDGKLRERELEQKARAAEEERRMADFVVAEYADLVRSLEGRRPSSSPNGLENGFEDGQSISRTPTLMDSYTQGKKGLQRLLGEFTVESERLQEKVSQLERELANVETKWEADRKTAELDRTLLGNVQAELVKIRIDDKAAARMVSSYMQFSQHSTVSLQKAMDTLKLRHATTVSTLGLEIDHLQISLASDRRQTKKLKSALDDLLEEISRETYGRRREVTLRLALLLREATTAEGLQRWSRKARELLRHSPSGQGDAQASFEKCVEDAEALLQTLNGDNPLEVDTHGSVARILAAQNAVATLTQELHMETEKRLELERQRALGLFNMPPTPVVTADPLLVGNQAGSLSQSEPSEHPKTNDTSPIGGTLSSTREVSIPATSLAGVMMTGFPKVVAASADTAAPSPTPALGLPEDDCEVNHSAKGPEQGAASFTPQTLMGRPPREPTSAGDMETNVVISSLDVLHQPAPRSHPEASFVHGDPVLGDQHCPPISPSPVALGCNINPPQPTTTRSLLSELNRVGHRYDDLQRAFRDCHLILKDLKKSVSSISPVTETAALLGAAIQRLDDFNEDARVEVEIRITDEELTARGYQTLLSVPGAISASSNQIEVEHRIRTFVDGTERTVAKITEQLHRKLDDLQHDVASVRKFLHDLPNLELQSTPQISTGWSSWTSILGGSPRTVSPAPPTFGTVMTSPRLRHSSSFTRSNTPGRKSSSANTSPTHRNHLDPFAGLGLRIPMPSHVMSPNGCHDVGQTISPTSPGPRPRKLSAMYMLGLTSGSTTLVVNSPQSVNFTPSKPLASTDRSKDLAEEPTTDGETKTGIEDELQMDVE